MNTFITNTTQSISSFVNTVRQTLTLDNVSRFNGYVITQIQSQRDVAAIVLVNSISFAILNKLVNLADQKTSKSLSENQYLLKHITLTSLMGASGLGVNLLFSRLAGYAMSKTALATLSLAYVTLRLALVKNTLKGKDLPPPPSPSSKNEDVKNQEEEEDLDIKDNSPEAGQGSLPPSEPSPTASPSQSRRVSVSNADIAPELSDHDVEKELENNEESDAVVNLNSEDEADPVSESSSPTSEDEKVNDEVEEGADPTTSQPSSPLPYDTDSEVDDDGKGWGETLSDSGRKVKDSVKTVANYTKNLLGTLINRKKKV